MCADLTLENCTDVHIYLEYDLRFVHCTLSTLNGAWNMDERIMLKHEKIICTYIYVLYILNMIMNTFYDSSDQSPLIDCQTPDLSYFNFIARA